MSSKSLDGYESILLFSKSDIKLDYSLSVRVFLLWNLDFLDLDVDVLTDSNLSQEMVDY